MKCEQGGLRPETYGLSQHTAQEIINRQILGACEDRGCFLMAAGTWFAIGEFEL